MRIGNTDLGDFPILLAPLEDVTDSAFREICRAHGADLVYTEFISSEALIRAAEKSQKKMLFTQAERPVGIQIFGNNVESMKQAAQLAEEQQPELIDINFGCPVRKVAGKGAGSALLQNIPLMVEITKAVVQAVKLPVTVKTRLGWDENSKIIVEVAENLQDVGIQALTIHGRTRAQMYSGVADWSLIGSIKNNPRMYIPIIGNGDVDSPEKAMEMRRSYGVDAVMIGRATIGNPWIFEQTKTYIATGKISDFPSIEKRIEVCLKHLQMAVERKDEYKGIIENRKHYSGYFRGIPDFKKTRMQLVTAKSLEEIESILADYKATLC